MKKHGRRNGNDRSFAAIRKLYGDRAKEQYQRFLKKKRIAAIFTILLSVILAAVSFLSQIRNPELTGGRYLKRNDPEGTEKQVELQAQSSGGYRETLQIKVPQQQYTDEELEELWDGFEEALKKEIFAGGDDFDHVSQNLKLRTALKGYPFRLKWRSDNPLILSSDGRIHEEKLEELQVKEQGIPVVLQADITCQDFEKTISVPVRIYGRTRSEEEVFWETVKTSIEAWNARTSTGEYQQLPDAVGQEKLMYRESLGKGLLFLPLIGIIAALLLVKHFDEDLFRRVKKRDEKMESEYPQLVNRFVLYYGAGLTIKNIWHRICRDYEARKKITGRNPVYEEMLKADHNMEDGVGEKEAYSSFASSIGLTRYRNLIALLQQSLQTGGADIRVQLSEQLRDAFAEQKRTARICGEKAGTKMLMPMFLMLAVVLAIILIPAFISFN